MPEHAPGRAVVLDASVAVALIRGEPAAEAARTTIVRYASAGADLLVPDLFWIEVANALIRHYATTAEEIVEAVAAIDDLGVESVGLDRALLLVGIDFQHARGLSANEAAYLALAECSDARLLTLDPRLADAAGERAIRLDGMPPRRRIEEPASRQGEPVDWARFGPYLARLRAAARAGAGTALGDRSVAGSHEAGPHAAAPNAAAPNGAGEDGVEPISRTRVTRGLDNLLL